MKITYIAKRHRDNKYLCHDVIADGIYLNLFLSDGAPVEKIAQHAEAWLRNPFPASRMNDSIQVIMDTPKEVEADLAQDKKNIPVIPEGKPSMQWRVVEMQNYMAFHGIEYEDNDTKSMMLKKIEKHFAA